MPNSNKFANLKIALVADNLTRISLSYECRVMNITPWNSKLVFNYWKPDLLLVESAWEGLWKSWKYKIAAYPDYPERNNRFLAKILTIARDAHIPTVFWNREDDVHFDRFIGSACLFDRIFTVDEGMISRYRKVLGPGVPVDVLMFAIQPAIHYPQGSVTVQRGSFVGSYGTHIHPARRVWQDMMFKVANDIGITVYDRNSNRKATQYRFPSYPWLEVKKSVPYVQTADIYRRHAANLNVNTIKNSPTAFSRRLVEILACGGGLAITNATPAVKLLFADYCELVDDEDTARHLLSRLARDGLSQHDRQRIRAGAEYVRLHHTWQKRLEQIIAIVD